VLFQRVASHGQERFPRFWAQFFLGHDSTSHSPTRRVCGGLKGLMDLYGGAQHLSTNFFVYSFPFEAGVFFMTQAFKP
jgi:hypothetical protein